MDLVQVVRGRRKVEEKEACMKNTGTGLLFQDANLW